MVANEEGVEGIRIFKRPLKIKPKDQINDLLLARMQKKKFNPTVTGKKQ